MGYSRIKTKQDTRRILDEMAEEEHQALEELRQMEYWLGLDEEGDGFNQLFLNSQDDELSWYGEGPEYSRRHPSGEFPTSTEDGVVVDLDDVDFFHDTLDEFWYP